MAGPQAQQTSASRAAQPLLNQTNRVDHRREALELVTCDDIRRRHIEIAVEEDTADEDSRHIRLKHKPFYRRLFSYIKNAWTGVTFSSGNDSELEELETPPRYRPDSLSALCRATRFSEAEIKRIYRGFKAECPTGVVREDTFKVFYSQFFPQAANSGQYAHYVFNTLDQDRSGIVSFEEFVQGLSILSRGSLEEKLRWTFSLYDINGDGFITREEMTDIATAIYDLVGHLPIDPTATSEEDRIREKVDRIFQKMDVNGDGVVTLEEFLDCCLNDEAISRSMAVFDGSF
ncbi:Kv channel-interacting protein 1 isoform X2 [Phlebotomus papatasi]|uniref:Kv channel-interacting protein 1 isoform X2 n=1 Tax=Phlebotomus papatasi TaxID=29031 RepID=UPI0024833800|nr:Kv channel-interacting protein 1 isoform X2 [Phlebotomus papatasi]